MKQETEKCTNVSETLEQHWPLNAQRYLADKKQQQTRALGALFA